MFGNKLLEHGLLLVMLIDKFQPHKTGRGFTAISRNDVLKIFFTEFKPSLSLSSYQNIITLLKVLDIVDVKFYGELTINEKIFKEVCKENQEEFNNSQTRFLLITGNKFE